MRRLALVVLFCSGIALADENGLRTENRTGKWWRTLGEDEKVVYLTGVADGAVLGTYYAIPKREENSPCRAKLLSNFLERQAVLAEVEVRALVKQLDELYADPANAKVMVPSAVFYLSRRAAGDPPKVLQDLLGGFRKNDG